MMGFVANHAQNEVMSLGMTIISEEMHHVKTGMMQLEVGVNGAGLAGVYCLLVALLEGL